MSDGVESGVNYLVRAKAKQIEVVKDWSPVMSSTRFVTENLVGRVEQRNTILQYLENIVLESAKGVPGHNLLIHGRKGTGKTFTTMNVLSIMQEYARREDITDQISFIYVSGGYTRGVKRLTSTVRYMGEAYEKLTGVAPTPGQLRGVGPDYFFWGILHYFKEHKEIHEALFIFDDVQRAPDLEFIRDTSRLYEKVGRDRFGVTVVAITNNYRKTSRQLEETYDAEINRKVHFSRYSARDITEILTQRVNLALYHPEPLIKTGALDEIGYEVWRNYEGDVRFALDVLETLLKSTIMRYHGDFSKLTSKDVSGALGEVLQRQMEETLSKLAFLDKALLVSLLLSGGCARVEKLRSTFDDLLGSIMHHIPKRSKSWFYKTLNELAEEQIIVFVHERGAEKGGVVYFDELMFKVALEYFAQKDDIRNELVSSKYTISDLILSNEEKISSAFRSKMNEVMQGADPLPVSDGLKPYI